jgi:subtilisin-like proprotein convertase family protein
MRCLWTLTLCAALTAVAQAKNGLVYGTVRGGFVAGERLRSSLDEAVISETFEAYQTGQLPPGWTSVDGDSGFSTRFERASTWRVFAHDGYTAHSGEKFVMCHFNDDALPNDDWLILPRQTVSDTIRLRYWAASQDARYLESFEVRLSTTGRQPSDFTSLIRAVSDVPAEWTSYADDLSPFAGAPFYVAFHYNAVDRFALKIDDVELEGTPAPTGGLTGLVTDDSARAVTGVRVQIPDVELPARTDGSGRFLLTGVPPGAHTLEFRHEYYYPQDRNVVVAVGETTATDVTLHARALIFRDYVSVSGPRSITDFNTASMPLSGVIQDTLVIYDLDVTATIEHTYVGDLDIWVRTADTIDVQLVAHDLSREGANLLSCRFDDEAELPFVFGTAPYTGRWAPLQPLNRLDGDSTIALRGNRRLTTWRLQVYDAAAQDQGRILGFSIHVAAEMPVTADEPRPARPDAFVFEGCYPNPFNAVTQFRFRLPKPAHVELTLYNLLGQEAARLLSRDLEAGRHELFFTAENLASGVYVARLATPSFVEARKVILLK